jgi:Membrane bound O-acyl transferase family
MPDWAFMWTLTLSIFAALKWVTWWRARGLVPHTRMRSLIYLFAWPGMDAEAFLDRGDVPTRPSPVEWLWAASKTGIGIVLLWTVAKRVPPQELLLRGWIGLFGLIFFLHFGSFHLISLFWRTVGITAEPIMDKPIRSKSLSEFWGRRWNLGFRQLAHDLIFRPLHRRIGVASSGFLVFLASGLLHDLVISFPAGGGYGLPTAYFTLQGLSVMLERSRTGQRLGLQRGFRCWLFMLVVTAAPVFWLFHPPFVLHVILPFMHVIHAI